MPDEFAEKPPEHAPDCPGRGASADDPCPCGMPTLARARRLLRLCQGVHATVLVGQATIVSFRTGRYYIVRGMGSRLFMSLIGGALRVEDFVVRAASFPSSPSIEKVRAMTQNLVGFLLAEGVIEPFITEEPPLPTVSSYTDWEAFVESRRYDDMADILTQDPIHEVGPQGWPERA